MHSRDSHICSASVSGEDEALVAEVLGREVHEETVLCKELYFVSCSVVSSGAVGMVVDLEGCANAVLRLLMMESFSTMELEEVEKSVEAILGGSSGSAGCEGA